MTLRNRSTRALVLLAIGSLATSTAAQPAAAPKKQPTQRELATARAHFKAAEAAKARGDYKAAATEYLLAHDLFQDPEFFFNVGEVYRLAGDGPNALTYYQKYLDLEPNGRGAAAARAAVDELKRSIAAKQDAAKRAAEDEAKRKPPAPRPATPPAATPPQTPPAATPPQIRPETPPAATPPETPPAAPSPAMPPAAPPPETRLETPRPETSPAATHAWYRDPITLGLLGTGVVVTGVGTGLLFSAQSLGHDAAGAHTYQQVLDLKDRASQRGTLGLITGGVGIALMGGGVAWIFLHRDAGEQRTVTGWLEPGGGGLAITGPF